VINASGLYSLLNCQAASTTLVVEVGNVSLTVANSSIQGVQIGSVRGVVVNLSQVLVQSSSGLSTSAPAISIAASSQDIFIAIENGSSILVSNNTAVSFGSNCTRCAVELSDSAIRKEVHLQVKSIYASFLDPKSVVVYFGTEPGGSQSTFTSRNSIVQFNASFIYQVAIFQVNGSDAAGPGYLGQLISIRFYSSRLEGIIRYDNSEMWMFYINHCRVPMELVFDRTVIRSQSEYGAAFVNWNGPNNAIVRVMNGSSFQSAFNFTWTPLSNDTLINHFLVFSEDVFNLTVDIERFAYEAVTETYNTSGLSSSLVAIGDGSSYRLSNVSLTIRNVTYAAAAIAMDMSRPRGENPNTFILQVISINSYNLFSLSVVVNDSTFSSNAVSRFHNVSEGSSVGMLAPSSSNILDAFVSFALINVTHSITANIASPALASPAFRLRSSS
jgi:hypothetical protein